MKCPLRSEKKIIDPKSAAGQTSVSLTKCYTITKPKHKRVDAKICHDTSKKAVSQPSIIHELTQPTAVHKIRHFPYKKSMLNWLPVPYLTFSA